MDTTLSPPIGQLLDGRYLVESQLARGGMATVYLGRDVRLDRVVALKIAHRELAGDQEFVRRFISEARSAARLSSPNVVAVFDQGSTGDLHYIAMEYVPGPTLRELLVARGALSPREALDIIEGVLAGLAAAHDAGIIHRDVKPENVLLGPDERRSRSPTSAWPGGRRRQPHQDRACSSAPPPTWRRSRCPASTSDAAHRRLRGRRDAVRDAHRRAAAHRRDRRWRSPTSTSTRSSRRRRRVDAGAARRAGRPRRPGHQPRSGPAAARRRALPGGDQRGPARHPAAAAAPRAHAARGAHAARSEPLGGGLPAARPSSPATRAAATRRPGPPAQDPLSDPLAQPGSDATATGWPASRAGSGPRPARSGPPRGGRRPPGGGRRRGGRWRAAPWTTPTSAPR